MITISNLHHYYNPGSPEEIHALTGIDLEIKKGEFLAIIGPNGCGKSTLVRHINGLLLPSRGEVRVGELNTQNPADLIKIRQKVGMVFQNPDRQLVASMVEEEVAFGPENLGMERREMIKRIEQALKAVSLEKFARCSPQTLSGGQKQRLAMAGILAMHPEYIILDEPASMLSPQGKKEVLDTVKSLNRKDGITVIYITHDLETACQFDRLIVMAKGGILMAGTPSEVFSQVEKLKANRLGVPRITELFYQLNREGLPLAWDVFRIEEAIPLLEKLLSRKSRPREPEHPWLITPASSEVIATSNLTHIYQKDTPFAAVGIKDVNLKIFKSEIVGITGETGSGKSTLIQHFNGILKPTRGEVWVLGNPLNSPKTRLKTIREKVGLVFQFPESQLFEETVFNEIAFGPKNMGISGLDLINRVKETMELLSLDYQSLKDRSPFSLSGGEMRWLAIAGMLALKPQVLVMDEPLAGIDPAGKILLRNCLLNFRQNLNMTVILVSHSMDELAELAGRLMVMKEGELLLDKNRENLFLQPDLIRELKLELPVYTRLMQELKSRGFPVKDAVFTLPDCKEQLRGLFNPVGVNLK